MNPTRFNWFSSIGPLTLGLLLTSCGSAPQDLFTPGTGPSPHIDGVAALPGGGCVSGQFNIGGYCVYAQSFQQACTMVPGGRIRAVSGVEVCELTHDMARFYGSLHFRFSGFGFPILNPGSAQSTSAFRTGIPVKAGDRLTWSARGGWGGPQRSTYSFLGFLPVTTYTMDCSYMDLNGFQKGTTTRHFYQGEPAQLLGTDGTHTFRLGSSANLLIQADGQLLLGFNVEQGNQYCGTLNISSLRVRHCEDASGTTYPCP